MLANHNAIESGGYVIDRSLRFSAASSNYLTRTFGAPTNNTVWSLSRWLKRGSLGAIQGLFTAGSAGIFFNASDQLIFVSNAGATLATSTRVFRDPSAHGHLHVTSNGTTIEAYWNNELALSYTGTITNLNSAIAHNIGRNAGGANQYFDGYDAEDYFVDGQALARSLFGETNVETGEWVAKPYTGTYGNNGSELLFEDGTSTTTLGNDTSGNNNNWTLTNFTRSAGVNDCWMKDVPAGNGEASAVQPAGNYAVLNPISIAGNTSVSMSGANLIATLGAGGQWRQCLSSLAMKTGKYYFEVTTTANSGASVGIVKTTDSVNGFNLPGYTANGYGYLTDGTKMNNTVAVAYGATWTTSDVIGVSFDADTGQLTFYKNNVSQGIAYTVPTGVDYYPTFGGVGGSTVLHVNFGQRSFAYTPPTGFKALCTSNLPTPTIKRGDDHFTAKTRTGTGATFSVSAIRHAVGWLFGKSRSAATDWYSYDVNRGVQKQLEFNTTSAETTEPTGLTAFNSDGYSGGALAQMNTNAATYIDYMMKAGGAPVSNTSGSITSQVNVNTTAGFSVVTWNAQASAGTVGHGLSKVPKLIIMKDRVLSGVGSGNWFVYSILGTGRFLSLNTTAGVDLNATVFTNAPTSSVFEPGSGFTTGNSYSTMVAYCFAEIEGFSKFGSYTGNGSADGPFVFTGFKPRWILIKQTSAAGNNWQLIDTARETTNPNDTVLNPNTSGAETTLNATVDVTANGFKVRTTDGSVNTNGATYIYAAFATCPLNYANAF